MIETGFSPRVQIQDIVDSQLPEFIVSDNPKFAEFLKQYYISQEYQGGPVDLSDNLDQYLNIDSLIAETIVDSATLSSDIGSSTTTIQVSSTKGYPESYGLFKIDDEIITYTSKTPTEFHGCVRGFSGVTGYDYGYNKGELIFSESSAASHTASTTLNNLSSVFLQQFYKKIKYALTPGLEGVDFAPGIDISNFIKEAKTFYGSKGTEESFRILFGVLYGEKPRVFDLEQRTIKPSSATNLRREVVMCESISGDLTSLEGQTIYKSTDLGTYATISEVDVFQRSSKTYYKVFLFFGYDDSFPPVFGDFVITGNTKNTAAAPVGAKSIAVDTTIGFPKSGVLKVGSNTISYTDKSINEFFNCSGITEEVGVASTITSSETYYGYGHGDLTNKVEFRITGIISDYKVTTRNSPISPGEEISVKTIGEKITNPAFDRTKKQIFANSWTYNTSSRIEIDSFATGSTSQVSLAYAPDRSVLKVGDIVEIVTRDSQTVIAANLVVNSIFNNQVGTTDSFTLNPSFNYDLRRKINFANVTNVATEFDQIVSDVQNVYNEDDQYMYVASNSLPSDEITKSLYSYDVAELTDYVVTTGKYSTIKFNPGVKLSFFDGGEVVYTASGEPIDGLFPGTYYADVTGDNTIRLYASNSSIGSPNYLTFQFIPEGVHNFTVLAQKEKVISPQKILKKFPLHPNIGDGQSDATSPGAIGMLLDGVEIYSYKCDDKIYYGPLTEVNVLNGGTGYDVFSPPAIESSVGGAKIQAVISGTVVDAFVDPIDFEINTIASIGFSGGNGDGAAFEPIIENRRRSLPFNAKQLTEGGGVDINTDSITFPTPHNLADGQPLIYDPGVYEPLGIGTYLGGNEDTGRTLVKDAEYYVSVLSDKTVFLYEKIGDYNAGINTVGFTTVGTVGVHNFLTKPNRQLIGLQVLNGGSGYTNRLLRVSPSGVSINTNTINFTNHGFNDGDLINYEYETSAITGLSSTSQYYVLKTTDNQFSLAADRTNFDRRKPVNLTSAGSGYQMFKYPDFSLNINYTSVGVGSTTVSASIVATPVIRGEIIDAYIYDSGTSIGSEVLNYEDNPNIVVKNGKNASISPIVNINGQITEVIVSGGGEEYFSTPSIVVHGEGTGAQFRPVINNGKLTEVIVINTGIGYSTSGTVLTVESAGRNAVLQSKVRSLSVNNNVLFKDAATSVEEATDLIISTPDNNLQYAHCAYSDAIFNKYNDEGVAHSPIIGWAYDGNPIYGSFGYSDPQDINSDIKRLESGYTKSSANVSDRPPNLPLGFFVDDYVFDDSGDLDQYNGRYCLTPEFPTGTYAYFAPSIVDGNNNNAGVFPYFIGDRYRSPLLEENVELNQDFDFNNSSLLRNTFPYSVSEENAENDFITESNEEFVQSTRIESITKGSIEEIEILSAGVNYKVEDQLDFADGDDGGSGLFAFVSELEGKDIVSLETSTLLYENAIFTKKDDQTVEVKIAPYHDLKNLDYINVSGLSTIATKLAGFYQIGVNSITSSLLTEISSGSAVDVDITLPRIPEGISIGNSIGIGTEIFTLQNIYNDLNVLRVSREYTSIAHTATSPVYFYPDKFTFSKEIDSFESSYNDSVYFNPHNSLGIGLTAGVGLAVTYNIGLQTNHTVSIPSQSIYLPNHPFKTNQRVILSKNSGISSIGVANTAGSAVFDLPAGNEQTVYVIRKSHDHIGIVTQIGLTTTTDGLFFRGQGTDIGSYNIKSDYFQTLANVQRINTVVSVSTSHNLTNGDFINLDVKPNLSVGIGTSTAIRVKYDIFNEKLLINPIEFSSVGFNTNTNQIQIVGHPFANGEKVVYNSDNPPVGLSSGIYFVYRVDDDHIQLCETVPDYLADPPIVVGITTAPAATHEISQINPPLKILKNNDVKFDVSDTSLLGYNFKFFYDQEFKDEFVSTGSTTTFSVVGFNTVGFTSAYVAITYDANVPSPLYYALEKSGYISTADNQNVSNYSEITYENSFFTGKYLVSGIAATTFVLSHSRPPEKTSYVQSECDVLKYTTTSKSALGGISGITITSPGDGYKVLPEFTGSNSVLGDGANLLTKSAAVGNVNQIEILNEGFDYSSDKTLRPIAQVPSQLITKNSEAVASVDVLDGGSQYLTPPRLVLYNTLTKEKIDSGHLDAEMAGASIIKVNVESPPKGLMGDAYLEVKTINNTNGVAIQAYEGSVGSGVVTCTLVTPLNGFAVEPFEVGDQIFVEGLTKYGTEGDGFNSEDYGYGFFTVQSYTFGGTDIPRRLEYNLSELTDIGPGIGMTGNVYGTVINANVYPRFEVHTEFSSFQNNEDIEVQVNGVFTRTKSTVLTYEGNTVKVSGIYPFEVGDVIRGTQSGSIATLEEVNISEGLFEISYSVVKNFGWQDDTGKLNDDTQVIPDNDYYQNLSYSIQTKKTWEEVVSPVNNLVHPSGLKNFVDTEILQHSGTIAIVPKENTDLAIDFLSEERVDTINNFDEARDAEVDVANDISKFVELKTTKLSDYVEVKSNRVLEMDDISPQFSNNNLVLDPELNLTEITANRQCSKFLVQATSVDYSQVMFTEVIVLNNNQGDSYTMQKGAITNMSDDFAEITASTNNQGEIFLQYVPLEIYNTSYNVKHLDTGFTNFVVGVSSISVGFVDVIGITSAVGVGSTQVIMSSPTNRMEAIHSYIHVLDDTTREMNYVELYVDHDGQNTNIAEFYFNSDEADITTESIGTFDATIEDGNVNIVYNNDTGHPVFVRTRNVGFGTVAAGIGTYRFKKAGQPDGDERTVTFDSSFVNTSIASTTIKSFDIGQQTSMKSTVRVSIGETSALHQLMVITDTFDVRKNAYTMQYPFLSIGSTSGIGTFGMEMDGYTGAFKFYPDPQYQGGGDIQISAFNENFHHDYDVPNPPEDLQYGNITESMKLSKFIAANDDDLFKTTFDLTHDGTPIFVKAFDPTDEDVINLSSDTSTLNITEHFFSTGEELVYRPKSSFISIESAPMQIVETPDHNGINTTLLPSTVFAIKDNSGKMRVATTKANAELGIAVTFTSIGSGNAHEFEMVEKLSKTLITVDNLIQAPISYSLLSFENVGGNVSVADSMLHMSGITSVVLGDLMKVEDEYVKVLNVGFGTLAAGPISFGGTFALLNVERGVAGTIATTHVGFSTFDVYRGSYTITENKVHFTDAPGGILEDQLFEDIDNLPEARSQFFGRVFLRSSYESNQIFDNISEEFTGLDQDYRLTVGGANTVGLGTSGGAGIILINGIYQAPTTSNNQSNNFSIQEDLSAGITTAVFSGITSSNGSIVISESDVNQNQLPRGGVIISFGSTPGLGYAPLQGASVLPIVGYGGTIIDVVGIPTYGTALGIDTVSYNNESGFLEITTVGDHNLNSPDVWLENLEFSCDEYYDGPVVGISNFVYDHLTGIATVTTSSDSYATAGKSVRFADIEFSCAAPHSGVTSTIFPYPNGGTKNSYKAYDVFGVLSVLNSTQFTVDVGITTIPHTYVSGGTVKSGVTTTIFPDGTQPGGNVFGIADITGSNTVLVNIGISSFAHTYVGMGSVYPYYRDLNFGSAYREPVSIALTDANHTGSAANITVEVDRNDHKFVSATTNCVTRSIGGTLSISTAHYAQLTGVLTLTFTGAHGLTDANTITIADQSLTFTCNQDFHRTQHLYPRSHDPASGANLDVLTTPSSTTLTVNVGASLYETGGRLKFNIVDGGSGYVTPQLGIEPPTYSNLGVIGQSRLGIGTTTDTGLGTLLNLRVGNSDLNTNGDIFFDAADLIGANKDFIADIAYGRMLAAYPSFVIPTANPQDCKDDIADLLQAMLYNLKFGGNDLTVDAAMLYITGAHVAGEEAETVYAFLEARDMAIQAMRNETITVGGHTTRTQVFDNTITVDSGSPKCATVASAISTLVGIVTTAVENGTTPKRTVAPGGQYVVEDFFTARKGYGFKKGDIARAVGLVTAIGLAEPIKHFELDVLEVFSDSFSAWQFGQVDYIDDISSLQDGVTTKFELRYQTELLSFEKNRRDPDSQLIEFAPLLIIFVNGILQKPYEAYTFEGGTVMEFTTPPKANDKVAMFFYRGSAADSSVVLSNESIKVGDEVELLRNNTNLGVTTAQDPRVVTAIAGFDLARTPLYGGPGIDDDNYKPFKWIKQKTDMILEGEIVSKARDSIETQVYPTAKIIDYFDITDTELFVDNAQFFNYEDPADISFDGIIINYPNIDPVAAGISAVVSVAGTISGLTIYEAGSGYSGSSLDISIAPPPILGVGVGTTATATVSIVNGSITSPVITNPGSGYDQSKVPPVLVAPPTAITDGISGVTNVEGFDGDIIGIGTTAGIGVPLAIEFELDGTLSPYAGLSTDFRIYIFDTHVGDGVTSILGSDSEVVGVGTTCIDNVYNISDFKPATGKIICNVHSGFNHVGIATTGVIGAGVAKFSWGRLSGFTRSSTPVSIGVSAYDVSAGLSTFPTLQRRGAGLRGSGALAKQLL